MAVMDKEDSAAERPPGDRAASRLSFSLTCRKTVPPQAIFLQTDHHRFARELRRRRDILGLSEHAATW